MRRSTACLAGAFIVLLGIGTGCNNNNNDDGGDDFVVANKTYNQIFNCSQTPTGGAAFCADALSTAQVQFTNMGGGDWEVRDVPDTGFLATGNFNGRTFNYTAMNPAGFTEVGTLTFNNNGNAFSGSSTYTADNATFTGECTLTGAVVPSVPVDPEAIGACP